MDHVKLVRNRPDIRFEGRIHEQSCRPSAGLAETWPGPTYSSPTLVLTTPRVGPENWSETCGLLHLDLADRPKHPFVLFNLGMTYADVGRCAEAAGYLRESIAVAGPTIRIFARHTPYWSGAKSGKGDGTPPGRRALKGWVGSRSIQNCDSARDYCCIPRAAGRGGRRRTRTCYAAGRPAFSSAVDGIGGTLGPA